jgi:hypothetical protein
MSRNIATNLVGPQSITEKNSNFMKQFAFQTDVMKSKAKTKEDKKYKELNQSKKSGKGKHLIDEVNLKLMKGLQANKSIKNKSSSR